MRVIIIIIIINLYNKKSTHATGKHTLLALFGIHLFGYPALLLTYPNGNEFTAKTFQVTCSEFLACEKKILQFLHYAPSDKKYPASHIIDTTDKNPDVDKLSVSLSLHLSVYTTESNK
jgi:hypothetical protein